MKKIFLFVAALSVCALAAESSLEERVDGLSAQIDRVMSKAGIHFGGEFRSQFLNSSLDGDAVADFGKKNESAEYTSVDFDIVARPNTALSARAIFRLHQDWRNFFSDVQNPITTRWLSIDGSVAQGILKYNLGDYKKKLTPLTLWSPDIDLLFEPEIFAQGRELAMSEVFLGENKRVLQGANVEFKAEVYPYLNELDVDVFGARLATRGTGESAPIAPGMFPDDTTRVNGMYWDSKYDKYLVGVNLATQIIKGAGFGVSNISVFDHVDSYRGEDFDKTGIIMNGEFEDTAKFHATSNNVFAVRLNLDNRAFMSDDFVHIGVNAEAAFSSYKYQNMLKNAAGRDSTVEDCSVDGMGINAGLSVKLNFDDVNAFSISADYILNDSAFINVAAQSPSFLQRSIMNNENGLSGLGLINPFDAMYRSVFKYAPSQYFGGSRPYTKNAYTNVIFPADKNGIAKLPTNVFQDALPGGFATADRSGPVVKLDGSFLDEAFKIGARVAMLNGVGEWTNEYPYSTDETIDPNDPGVVIPGEAGTIRTKIPINEYMTAGGGAIVDIAKFVPAVGPSLKIGGSYMMYNSTIGDVRIVDNGRNVPPTAAPYKHDVASNLISVELNYNFVQRFSFLVGYQQLATSIKSEENVSGIPDAEYAFSNLGIGFGYKVADGGALTVKLTMLSGEGPVGVDENTGKPKTLKYTATQPEVYLTVKF
ncbi:MAG: hypothetical protein LBC59_04875 [Chitinispirillales bacterium]|jgi:hypothetical protein|nr:hypothetical protein [Chitinispirillales bacterium]